MNNLKSIVLLTSAYPLYDGEFFLDDEINLLAPNFEKIYVLCFHNNQKVSKRPYPSNVIPFPINKAPSLWNKIQSAFCFFEHYFWDELFHIKKRFNVTPTFFHLKIMLNSIAKANLFLFHLQSFLKLNKIESSNTILYSYWHDEMALALSFWSKREQGAVCIARAHGWDVEYKRHKPPYLPFKKHIIESLDKTFTISQGGKTTFDELLNFRYTHKTEISRLGKFNHRIPLLEKKGNIFVLCSCSNLIPLKRVHLIVDILSELNIPNLHWIHFGSGPLLNELINYATQKIPNINFDFKGVVPNNLILDYYGGFFIDLFINVSETEGIPVSIMEAQSAGIPVIATNVGGTNEIINQENGFLISKDICSKDVAATIANYLKSDSSSITNKRLLSFENWNKNYNAKKNYSLFETKIKAL